MSDSTTAEMGSRDYAMIIDKTAFFFITFHHLNIILNSYFLDGPINDCVLTYIYQCFPSMF